MPTPTSTVPNVYGTDVPTKGVERLAYAAEVMRLASTGKRVQYRSWQGSSGEHFVDTMPEIVSFSWGSHDYRILASEKPKKMVPWRSPTDFPCEAQFLRTINSPSAPTSVLNRFSTIVGMGAQGMYYTSGATVASVYWASSSLPQYEWSSDRVNWHPCTVEVEE